MNNKTDIEEDIKIVKQLITTKFNNDYSIDSTETLQGNKEPEYEIHYKNY